MNHLRKPLAILLALALLLSLLPAALAAPDSSGAAEPTEITTDAPMPNGMRVQTPYGLRLGSGKSETREETEDLPARYNSADLGLVTPVKNQTQYGQYGTCWAFGTLSPIETYMIKNGMQVGRSGVTAATDLDLSEYHLSYFTYSNSYDEHGLTDGDSSILDQSHLNVGGDGYKATLTLMRWIGVTSEEEADLAYSECSLNSTIDPKYAYAYDAAHVTGVDWIDPENMTLVKQYLMEFGSAFIGYYYNPSYQGSGGAYCYISTNANNDYGPNHGVTLVGWDDTYSKSNFTGLSKPQNDGAWIVKNSWGNSSYTDHGYTYISYEDSSYLGHPIMFFTVESLDAYDHLYQYDGTCFTGDAAKGWIPLTQNRSLVSNVFTAAGHETVEAFSICTLEEDLGYTLEVYKNPTNLTGSSPDPCSGTLMSSQTGTIAHSGYHSIRIASPFKVEEGDKFSAVFTLDSQQSAQNFQMVIPVDESQTEDYTENGSHLATLTHTHVSHPGTSFFRLRDNSTWSQLDNGASLRIKAYTSDAPFELTVEAGPHGTAVLGDYTAQGYQVTAAPDSGYYASGYTITAGNAAVIQNGSVFCVNPTEATTIRIDFAPQTPFTLRYSANGAQVGSAVTGMTGDAVTLPATAPAFEGYTFLGWASSAVPEAVTGKPLCLEPGAVYYPLGGSTTLYALYAFQALAVPGQDGSYVKITASAEFTDGSYLIVNEESLHALDGSKANSAGMWTPINTAPNYVDVSISNGRIPDSAVLRAADFSYDSGSRQFYSASGFPVGGYKNGYYFYVWGAGSTLAAQTVSFDSDGNAVIKDDYYKNTLCYTDASPAYFAYLSNAGNPVQLYRKTEDTTQTCYTTSIGGQTPPEPTEPIETEALHIYSSISVGTDMVITLTIRKNDLTNYEKFWIEVVKHEPDGDVTYVYEQEVLTENNATWTYQFNKIYATEMGLDVEARLYVEDAAGQVYMSPARNANIREHLGGRLTATNNIVEQRVLAADMLNYGAAAQLYMNYMNYQTDHLVNEELTDEQLEKLHQYETKELPAADKVNSNYRPEGQSNILFNSMTLGNEVLLNLTVRLPEDTENVQVLVKEHDGGAQVATLDTTRIGSTFQTTFSGIGADKMRTEYDMVTLVDGVETGNIRTWSVEGRVVEIRNGSNQLMTNVANALLTYGDAAAAYKAAQQSS